jgi:hypothetical protein
MKIRVEERHIQGAVAGSATMCPIARALREQLGGQWIIKTLGEHWDRACQWPGTWYRLPTRAIQFSKRHTAGDPVEPIAFVLKSDEAHT